MKVAAGLDGGGSTLRLLAVNESGEVVHESRSGSASWAHTPRDVFLSHLAEVFDQAPFPDALYGCFAGVLTAEDRKECAEVLASVSGAKVVAVAPDYAAGLAACPENALCLVIAGTGSLVCSRTPFGIVRTSGGGPLLGDEGSVYSLTRALLAKMLRTPADWPEGWWARVNSAFEAETPDTVLRAFYRHEDRARRSCSLVDLFNEDDPRLNLILEQQIEGLAKLVCDHLVQHGDHHGGPIMVMGGLWGALPSARHLFERQIARMSPSLGLFQDRQSPSVDVLTEEPVAGAVKMAWGLLDSTSAT